MHCSLVAKLREMDVSVPPAALEHVCCAQVANDGAQVQFLPYLCALVLVLTDALTCNTYRWIAAAFTVALVLATSLKQAPDTI